MPVNQGVIRDKFQKYLIVRYKNDPISYKKEYCEEIFKKLSNGHCSGFSLLWAYYMSIGQEDYFNRVMEKISNWDESEDSLKVKNTVDKKNSNKNTISFENKLVQDFESMISQVILLQGTLGYYNIDDFGAYSQSDQAHWLNIINPEKFPDFVEEIKLSLFIDFKSLNFILEKVIKEDKIIMLGSDSHSISVYKRGGTIFFYDVNNLDGAVEIKDIDSLSKSVMLSFKKNIINNKGFLGFSVSILGRNESKNILENKNNIDRKELIDYSIKQVELRKKFEKLSQDQLDNNSLYQSAKYGDLETFKYLIESKKFSIDTKNSKGFTVLDYAVYANQVNIVEYIYEMSLQDEYKHINFSELCYGSQSALSLAVNNKNNKIIDILISMEPNQLNKSLIDVNGRKHTILTYCIIYNKIDLVEHLLSNYKSNIDFCSQISFCTEKKDYYANIIYNMIESKNIDMLKIFFKHLSSDIPPDSINDAFTLYRKSRASFDVTIVEYLILKGANINTNDGEKSVLSYALLDSNYDFVLMLLNKGAEISEVDSGNFISHVKESQDKDNTLINFVIYYVLHNKNIPEKNLSFFEKLINEDWLSDSNKKGLESALNFYKEHKVAPKNLEDEGAGATNKKRNEF